MSNPWRDKVLTYNAKRKVSDEKASDMDVVIRCLRQLPPGQLKQVLEDEELLTILNKYGITA